ncbi:hypothetical protein VNO80_05602 [Phaseolus coccineus]|uniref:Uncharacterized protein n=1 Tax=Phaseolus coccineus TaxID=3886 RepID=A0AAN9RI08_PHACN
MLSTMFNSSSYVISNNFDLEAVEFTSDNTMAFMKITIFVILSLFVVTTIASDPCSKDNIKGNGSEKSQAPSVFPMELLLPLIIFLGFPSSIPVAIRALDFNWLGSLTIIGFNSKVASVLFQFLLNGTRSLLHARHQCNCLGKNRSIGFHFVCALCCVGLINSVLNSEVGIEKCSLILEHSTVFTSDKGFSRDHDSLRSKMPLRLLYPCAFNTEFVTEMGSKDSAFVARLPG